MKSTNLEVTPELVSNLLLSKRQLEEMQQKLADMNLFFGEAAKGKRQLNDEQIKYRQKVRADFTVIQNQYIVLTRQVSDYKTILKQIRLGELRLIDDGQSLTLVESTKKNLNLSLCGILPSLDPANNFY